MSEEDIADKIKDYSDQVSNISTLEVDGKVTKVVGMVIEASLPNTSIGELCYIKTPNGNKVRAEVVGFRESQTLLMPLDKTVGVSSGCTITRSPEPMSITINPQILGRVLDGLWNPMDNKQQIDSGVKWPVYNTPPNPLKRTRINEIMPTGVKAIDGLATLGRGQRIGIFAGSGVGKSVLLGMIARYAEADVNVIALVGERGREVREFIERDLGEEGLKKSVVIVATSDQAPMVRVKAALTATAVSEYFRDRGKNVMLLMDSLTRVAMAKREIGLAAGEPPATKGYTPSVFGFLPKLLERTGTSQNGSITAIYSVLVEGDDLSEPVSDTARSILDGHIVLDRDLANSGHYPAIDVLGSISRLKDQVIDEKHRQNSIRFLELLAKYKEQEDLINIGAYESGTNPELDKAIENIDQINDFLTQDISEHYSYEETVNKLNNFINNID